MWKKLLHIERDTEVYLFDMSNVCKSLEPFILKDLAHMIEFCFYTSFLAHKSVLE